MNFLLDHWWIANVVPYFGFNAWLIYVFERDEGPFTNSARFWFALFGLWIVLVSFVWIGTGELIDLCTRMYRSTRSYQWIRWRSFIWNMLLTISWVVMFLLAILGLYVLALATITDLKPHTITYAANGIGSIAVIFIIYNYYRSKKGN